MLVVLGIGSQVDMYEINNMASWPYERNAIAVSSYLDLPTVEARLSNTICAGKYTVYLRLWIFRGNIHEYLCTCREFLMVIKHEHV